MSPISNDDDDQIKPDALNAIRPRVSSPAPSSTAASSLNGDDDDDKTTLASQLASSVTPIAPSKKRIRLCAIDVNTKLQFARPAPLTFVGAQFDLESVCSETDDTDSTASSSFHRRKLKKRKIRRSGENLVIVGPSFLMGGAAPALMELWKKKQTSSATVPQIEQLRAGDGASRRSSVLDLTDDVSRKLDFEDEEDAAMMVPLDSPPPFDDDETPPEDDPFNASNRPSSIGRVSDFPPAFDIDETKSRGLNDSSVQMFRLLVRSGLVDSDSETMLLRDTIYPYVSRDAILDHRHFRLSNGPVRSHKHFAASAFAQLLVLTSRDVINVSQNDPMGEIVVSPGRCFTELASMVSAF